MAGVTIAVARLALARAPAAVRIRRLSPKKNIPNVRKIGAMMTELEEAVLLANRLLDEPGADPDDDLRMLARQFLRQKESAEKGNAAFAVMMQRGWYPVCDSEKWSVDGQGTLIVRRAPNWPIWPDPFTAIVEADKWYRENVEKQS